MTETALESMRRQARWLARLMFLSLLPGMLTGAVALLASDPTMTFVAWCGDWWWTLLFAGGVVLLLLGTLATWVAFRCPACRFRLSRGPVVPTDFLPSRPPIRFCPHCGVNLADTHAKTGSGSLPQK
jgi:hypothetical protein